jgi:hypothetical protein
MFTSQHNEACTVLCHFVKLDGVLGIKCLVVQHPVLVEKVNHFHGT